MLEAEVRARRERERERESRGKASDCQSESGRTTPAGRQWATVWATVGSGSGSGSVCFGVLGSAGNEGQNENGSFFRCALGDEGSSVQAARYSTVIAAPDVRCGTTTCSLYTPASTGKVTFIERYI